MVHTEMATWLGREVCVHWDEDQGMEGEGWKLEDDCDGVTWFVVDYGYAVRLDAITAAHNPEDCPRLEGIIS